MSKNPEKGPTHLTPNIRERVPSLPHPSACARRARGLASQPVPIARRACVILSLATTALVPLVPSATARSPATPAKVRACGLVGRFAGRLYDVRETKGSVPCRRVRQVVSAFFRTGEIRPAPGWICFRGHGQIPWAASCSRGKTVLVRVYPPT